MRRPAVIGLGMLNKTTNFAMILLARAKTNQTPTYFTRDKADVLVVKLMADAEDHWSYTANHNEGYSTVSTYDETGEFIGKL